jgi:hypothetical protein
LHFSAFTCLLAQSIVADVSSILFSFGSANGSNMEAKQKISA